MQKHIIFLLVFSICWNVSADSFGACTSRQPFSLDISASPRVADVREKLTFDSTWYGNQSSTVKLRINDADLAEAMGVGFKIWKPHRPGTYTITATT